MDGTRLRAFLRDVHAGKVSIEEAAARLAEWPFADLGFAKVDHHRTLRCGFAEVVFGSGKEPDDLLAIFERAAEHAPVVLATRLAPEQAAVLCEAYPEAEFNPRARTVRMGEPEAAFGENFVAVVTAGTSDIPVAEEAAETLRAFGCRAETVYDVGVAGLHRLLHHLPLLRQASACVVAAGMEGALPSVVGGMVQAPVVAVPTSVGYGASFGGLAALLGMLNTCAAGVTVVNIDNGFGAASAALRMLQSARLSAARNKRPEKRKGRGTKHER